MMIDEPAVPVRLSIDDGLATIMLARPHAGNALDWTLVDSFSSIAERVAIDPVIRSVLIGGEGRNFCVGGDLKVMASEDNAGDYIERLAGRLHVGVAALAAGPAPVVIAVQGAAAGAGLSLVAGADIVIAGRSSTYTMAYTAIGLVADGGATWSLPRVIGLRRTQEMAFLQRKLTAQEALDYGLVTRVVDDEQVATKAASIARQLAAGPTQAYGRLKQLLGATFGANLPDQLGAEAKAIGETMRTDDADRAIASFLRREAPTFNGR